VFKFLHHQGDQKCLAIQEVNNWNSVYKKWFEERFPERLFVVMNCSLGARVFLILPFFRVPADYNDRLKIAEGHKTSPLMVGLQFFADKGKIHKDLRWRHIGVVPRFGPIKFFVLLDLGEGVEACDDIAKRDTWVKESYSMLESRMGDSGEDVDKLLRAEDPNPEEYAGAGVGEEATSL
jgi:hypothetical protein